MAYRNGVVEEALVPIFIPDKELVWVSASSLYESSPGNHEVDITDEDFPESRANSRRKAVKLSDAKDILGYALDSFPLQNEGVGPTGVDDMTSLGYLHEASILDNLRRRHKKNLPYTYTGDICIAVNPYRWLDIYTTTAMEAHEHAIRQALEPHVYATSASAFRGLAQFDRNQSILVSGESGAGKTETVKILMNHIAHIAGKQGNSAHVQKVLESNPLLESFGNAKTKRNDNSSRFGKFTQLQFDSLNSLAGSRCVTYLLEKSRVVFQNEGERNYHIFHQILAAPEDVKTKLQLKSLQCNDFNYTNKGDTETDTIEGVGDGRRFQQTIDALNLLGVSYVQKQALLRILAGILFLGQLEFSGDLETSHIHDQSLGYMETSCSLLNIRSVDLKELLTKRMIFAGGEQMEVGLSVEKAADGRDALAKDIYARLFLWLVGVVNHSTVARMGKAYADRTISLLDIFGFETFKTNRFEQMCINYANERLQQKFTEDVFEAVQTEYKEEGLEWESIGYKDNQETIDLLEGRMGLLTILNEECRMPAGNDENFLRKLKTNCSSHPNFPAADKLRHNDFCVLHYAGKVSYTTTGFVERNKDHLPPDLISLMGGSENVILAETFKTMEATGDTLDDFIGVSSKGKKHSATRDRRKSFVNPDSVMTKFRHSLDRLMHEISATDVQYVRCIKPNELKSDMVFDRQMVVSQLRSAGMIEAIRISRAAYPYRLSHGDFLNRFAALRPRVMHKFTRTLTQGEKCAAVLRDIWPDADKLVLNGKSAGLSRKAYEIGRTRVYFSSGILETLEEIRTKLIFNHAVRIQAVYRGYRLHQKYLWMRSCAIKIQTCQRSNRWRRLFRRVCSMVLSLQRLVRVNSAKKKLMKLKKIYHSIILQSVARMIVPRIRFRRKQNAMIKLGAWMKMKVAVKRYKVMLEKAKADKVLRRKLDALKSRLAEEVEEQEEIEKELERRSARANEAIEADREQIQIEKAELEAERTALEEKMRAFEEKSVTPNKSYTTSSNFSTPGKMCIDTFNLTAVSAQKAKRVEELQVVEALQKELAELRATNAKLTDENDKLRSEQKISDVDHNMRLGELAFSKVAVKAKEKEVQVLKSEKASLQRLINQYKVEKKHVMNALMEMSIEVDIAHNEKHIWEQKYITERRYRTYHFQASTELLKSRGVAAEVMNEFEVLHNISYSASQHSTSGLRSPGSGSYGRGSLGRDSMEGEFAEPKARRKLSDVQAKREKIRKLRSSSHHSSTENISVISSISTHRQQPAQTERSISGGFAGTACFLSSPVTEGGKERRFASPSLERKGSRRTSRRLSARSEVGCTPRRLSKTAETGKGAVESFLDMLNIF
jgi:myosin-5